MDKVFVVVDRSTHSALHFDTLGDAAFFSAKTGGQVLYRKIAPPHVSTFDELMMTFRRLDHSRITSYGASRSLSVKLAMTRRGIELFFPDGAVVWSVGRASSTGGWVKTFDVYDWAVSEIDRRAATSGCS